MLKVVFIISAVFLPLLALLFSRLCVKAAASGRIGFPGYMTAISRSGIRQWKYCNRLCARLLGRASALACGAAFFAGFFCAVLIDSGFILMNVLTAIVIIEALGLIFCILVIEYTAIKKFAKKKARPAVKEDKNNGTEAH
jgi:tetrahydromethanopterin S-methyltransferase subunit E